MSGQHSKPLGAWAEQQACIFLQQQHFQLLARNFHSRYGEIDLIVRNDTTLVFVEVKARSARAIAPAHAVISVSKQRKMSQTALYFLQCYPEYSNDFCRFDVISFDFLHTFPKTAVLDFNKLQFELQWIENAFTFDEELINL
jgi:putative endonuclease